MPAEQTGRIQLFSHVYIPLQNEQTHTHDIRDVLEHNIAMDNRNNHDNDNIVDG